MNRITSILAGLSLAVLFCFTSAQAQSVEQKVTANIPFDFNIGSISLPAGQYEFLRNGSEVIQIRDANRHTLFAMSSGQAQPNDQPDTSILKFAIVDGRHVLVQIWNETAGVGDEFAYVHPRVEWAKGPNN